jgi:hypothetical protein
MKKTNPHKRAAVPALRVDESVSLEEQIAQRAHELRHRRGRNHGSDMADWFQAEREVNEWHHLRLRNPSVI